MENEVKKVIRSLGISRFYRGFQMSVNAVLLVIEDERRLGDVIESIYQQIADENGTNWAAVERNIRTVAHKAWQTNSRLLMDMAGYSLRQQPTVSEFIEIVSNYVSSYTVNK